MSDPFDAFFNNDLKEESKSTLLTTLVENSSDDYDGNQNENDEFEELFKTGPNIDAKRSTAARSREEDSTVLVKNVYITPKELENLSPEEVDKMRMKIGNITVHGLNVPCPISKWYQCGLPANVMTMLKSHQFHDPTAIQCQAIP